MKKIATAKSPRKVDVTTIVGLGLLTAMVAVLQTPAASIHIGSLFSITLALAPMVVGAALFGKWAGMWLGFVFGMVVLLTGDANAFLVINVPGTIITVLLKGMLSGFCAGIVYRLIEKRSMIAAVLTAGVVSPVVNTGIFLIGGLVFFYDTIAEWAGGADVLVFMLTVFVGLNFFVELGINLILSSAIVAIIKIGKKTLKKQ